MDGVFVIIGAFDVFSSLKSKNYLRATFNFNDSYCPLIDLMIFRCKSKKIASVRLAVLRVASRATIGRYDDVHFDEKDGETISKFSEELNLSVLFRLTRNPRPAHQCLSIQNNSVYRSGIILGG